MPKKNKVYGFTKEGFEKVRAATRIVLAEPRVGARRRRQTPVSGNPLRAGEAKADVNINPRSTGAISIWDGPPGNGADTLRNETGFNLSESTPILTGDWLWYFRVKGGFGVLPMNSQPVRLGKTDSAVTSGNSGTVSIYEGATIGSESDTGNNQTAYNRGPDIASGAWVNIMYRGDSSSWEMFPINCP